jgi:hypothetical protein
MKTASIPVGIEVDRVERVPGGAGFDWAVVATCLWFEIGAYLDAWAHTHSPDLETFFTPWHAVLYSGFLATALVLAVPFARGHARGLPWSQALPPGYGLSLVGVLIFAVGGVADMLWHVLFGIEADVEALLSPSHLVLALGSTLILTGPLRAAWKRPDPPGAGASGLWPMAFSLAFLLSSFTFWTQYAHAIARPWAAAGNRPTAPRFLVYAPDPLFQGSGIGSVFVAQALGVASIVLQAALLAAVVLLAVRRWGAGLPPGSLTLVFALNAAFVGLMRDEAVLVPFAALAGLAADALLRGLRPSIERTAALRAFAFAMPAVYYALYFVGLAWTKGIWWSIHLWTGAVVMAGAAGWLLSYLVAPPPAPERPRAS